jgi:transposase-like protein
MHVPLLRRNGRLDPERVERWRKSRVEKFLELRERGLTWSKSCRRVGVNDSTLSRWVILYKTGDSDALRPKYKPGPGRQPSHPKIRAGLLREIRTRARAKAKASWSRFVSRRARNRAKAVASWHIRPLADQGRRGRASGCAWQQYVPASDVLCAMKRATSWALREEWKAAAQDPSIPSDLAAKLRQGVVPRLLLEATK